MPARPPQPSPRAAPGDDATDRLDELFPLAYAELRRIARCRMRGERAGHTLDTTALVHEAYLKLSRLNRIDWQGRTHLLAVAAQAMRRVLVDHAVGRNAQKRGGGRAHVTLDRISIAVDDRLEDLLALDDALERLKAIDERQCRVVECRFFAGMTVDETAEALDVSSATVKRDWRMASAWLYRALNGGAGPTELSGSARPRKPAHD